jgi:adenylate cyclase
MRREGSTTGWGLFVAVGIAGLAVALVLPMERLPGFYPGALGEFFAGIVRQGNAAWSDSLLRGAAAEPSPHVVLVTVDDHTTRAFNAPVLPRAAHARLVRNLTRAGARVIAFDFLFDRAREGDEEFAAAMREHGRVLLAWAREDSADPNRGESYPVLPHDGLAQAAYGLANVNLPNDPDGLIRRFFAAVSLPDPDDPARMRSMPCFPLAVADAWSLRSRSGLWALSSGQKRAPAVTPRDRRSPSPSAQRPAPSADFIAYRGPDGFSCRRIPYYQACWADDPAKSEIDMARLSRWVAGRAVLVGNITEAAHDTHPTPWGKMPGVEIQANAVDTLLTGRAIDTAPVSVQVVLLVLGALLAALLPVVAGRLIVVVPVGLLLLAAPLGISALLYGERIWLPPVEATTGMAIAFLGENLYVYASQRRRARALRRHFARFVGPRVMSEILREGYVELQGERREITLLFSDLQGFTTLSERLPPARVVALLNEYLNRMVAVIFAHHGTLDKFMGDGIMAYFGAPQPSSDHAEQAVRCALEMQRVLAEWREETAGEGGPTILMRIGIHTGPAVVGEMGSRLQASYTAIGDTVNVAARLEPLNKQFGTTILISESTLAAVGDAFATEFKGELQVKGREEPVRVYTVHVDEARWALGAGRCVGEAAKPPSDRAREAPHTSNTAPSAQRPAPGA